MDNNKLFSPYLGLGLSATILGPVLPLASSWREKVRSSVCLPADEDLRYCYQEDDIRYCYEEDDIRYDYEEDDIRYCYEEDYIR